MRRKMIEEDIVECVIGLGPNLFYNSSMVSCLLVTNNNKSKARKGKILIIQAVDQVRKEKTMSYLDDHHIERVLEAYQKFESIDGFCQVLEKETVLTDAHARLSVDLHVSKEHTSDHLSVADAAKAWTESSANLSKSMNELLERISG